MSNIRGDRSVRVGDVPPGTLLIPPVAVTATLWLTTPNPVQVAAAMATLFLLTFSWGSFLHWQSGRRDRLPLFAMIAAGYWLFFGLPLFWGQRVLFLYGYSALVVSEESMTQAALMALLGVVFLWVGMRLASAAWTPSSPLDVIDAPPSWVYIRVLSVTGALLSLDPRSYYFLGGDARQVMIVMVVVVPNIALMLVVQKHLRGMATQADTLTLVAGCGLRLLGALVSGALGPLVNLCVMCGALIVLRRGAIPWKVVFVTAAVIVFLQVGKNDFRTLYWNSNGASAPLMERAQYWIQSAASRWGIALGDSGGESTMGLAAQSLERASLLPQVAHVVDMTPSVVPFQGGQTYRYMRLTLIPRLLWPDKPSVSEANRFYQLAYGLTNERDLANTSIAIGVVAEAYINFGWIGVVGIMCAIGLVLGLLENIFGTVLSGSLFLAIGVALLPGLLTVESQLAQYLGGTIQQAVLAILIFLPITKRGAINADRSMVHSRNQRVAPPGCPVTRSSI